MELVHEQLISHQRECMNETRLTREAIQDLRSGQKSILDKMDAFNLSAWKGLGAIMLVILAGVVTIVASNITAHADVASKSEVAVRTADRYTASDASRDRKAQDDRDAALMAKIEELHHR